MEHIYHYTTIDSLLGMTSNTSKNNPDFTLWASHFSCLNDPQERRYGEKILMDVINELEEEHGIAPDERIRSIENNTLSELYSLLADNEQNPMYAKEKNKYIISFSKQKDYLPMWSMYGKNGNGVCLELDQTLISQDIFERKTGTWLADVWYGRSSVEAHKTEIFENYQRYKNTGYRLCQNKEGVISLTTDSLKLKFTDRIKHDAYAYEKEIRLIIDEKDPVKYRTSNGYLIPYVEYQLPIDCITNIIIGPSLDQERLVAPLKKMLWQRGFDLSDLNIELSTIPYRI